MSWKKIIALASFLAVLVAVIVWIEGRERDKKAAEGVLLDIPRASLEKIELRNGGGRYVFSRRDALWYLDEPLATRADKVLLEGILDNFSQLRYDRLVEEGAADLKGYGLEPPEIELKLFAAGRPAATVLLGMKNAIDESSYAKLAGDGRVVTLSSYKRGDLEKDLFAFRDKKFLDIDTMAVGALEIRRGASVFSLAKKEGRWHLEKPLYSLAQESKVNDILTAASTLEALSFAPAGARPDAFGLDRPQVTVEFRSADGVRKLAVGQKGEQYFALVEGAGEICGIDKGFIEKVPDDAAALREKRPAPFYAFDVRELSFRQGEFAFAVRKDDSGNWAFLEPQSGKKPGQEKVDRLLTALADLEAREFIDSAPSLPPFPTRVSLKLEDAANQGKQSGIIIEFSAAAGETVVARNPSLPYQFRIGKEILEKFPVKMADITEDISTAAGE